MSACIETFARPGRVPRADRVQQSALTGFQRLSGRVVSTDEAIRELAASALEAA